MEWFAYLQEFNVISVIVRLLIAMLCGAYIGREREKLGRAAGLRTHILVCVGACMTSLIGIFVWTQDPDSDPLRVSAQVISGIGFLGVGTIMVKGRDHITGLTTAATLWTTATLGIAVGFGFYEAAIICTLLVAITTGILCRLEDAKKKKNRKFHFYAEIEDVSDVNEVVDKMVNELHVMEPLIVPPRSASGHHVGIEGYVLVEGPCPPEKLISELRAQKAISFAVENQKASM